ncbi:MAG: hypothetical protein ACOYMN_15660 [Roseimicrobium sp.]
MTPPATSTLLRFTGDWPALPVFVVALGLAGLMFFYYRRELRFHQGPSRWVLPLLRSVAVFLLVLCLAGPVLRQVTTYRQLGRVVVVADASASMSFTDELTVSAIPKTENRGPLSQTSRFSRLEKALLEPGTSLIHKLAEKHDVELFALRGYKADRLWWRREGGNDLSGDLPTSFELRPDATITNLDQPLRDALGPSPAGTALVLLSDGQHNAPGSPEELAASLKEGGIPVFTIGYGSEAPPPDLALLNVTAPEAVFAEDRAEGVLSVQDSLPAGLPAQAIISYANKVLWSQPFTTLGNGERHFDLSFPVRELPQTGDAKQTLRLLNFRVELLGTSASKDRITDNNGRVVALHLLTRKRKVLILDGRARWETRYLHNHFDRDERWEVTAAFDDFSTGPSPEIQRVFPKDRDALAAYDLIVLGDLRPEALTNEQRILVQEFVEKRGGGLILVDGRRNHLQAWQKTAAAALLPVAWGNTPRAVAAASYSLTDQGRSLEALRLSDSPSANEALWRKLPKTQWGSAAQALAGAMVLAQLTGADKQATPAIVWRRLGAGSVLWLGTDEMWRWRYEVADQHHQRFWMQMAAWIAAPPFFAEDARLSLGSDRLRYQEGDSAEVRVRLRNEKGTIVTEAKPRAHLMRNGIEIASMELEPDPAHGGVFRAITGTLSAGDYQITVTESRTPASDTKLAFRVESHANQEWAQLTLNRPLLEGMARASGGRFMREGDLSQLPDLLQQLDRPETRVRETLLWSSWWWLTMVIALLTAEWLLRKRWRLV